MRTVRIADLVIPANRQRRTFDLASLNELAESIQKSGLFHPIVCREENDKIVLCSGERRLRAISDIHELGGTFYHDGNPVSAGEIPYITLGELSPLEAEEAELEENVRRVDLTWQEKAAATARLASLRNKQAVAAGVSPPTVADISEEVRGSSAGSAHEETREELIVAKHLDKPDIAAAKSVGEAFKLLKRKEEAERNVQLAEKVGRLAATDLHQVEQKEALAWLTACPAEQYDVVLADPPYGIDAQKFGDAGGRLTSGQEHHYDDTYENWLSLMPVIARESFRIAKPQAHCYLFCDIDRFVELKVMMQTAGWYVHRTPLIDYKLDGNRVPLPEQGPQRKFELILYAIKGWRPVTKIYPDVIPCRGDENLGHGAQKPISLLEDLLRRSVRPGDTVVDFFAGTGGTLIAGHNLSCRVTLVEASQPSYALCLKRLESLVPGSKAA